MPLAVAADVVENLAERFLAFRVGEGRDDFVGFLLHPSHFGKGVVDAAVLLGELNE